MTEVPDDVRKQFRVHSDKRSRQSFLVHSASIVMGPVVIRDSGTGAVLWDLPAGEYFEGPFVAPLTGPVTALTFNVE